MALGFEERKKPWLYLTSDGGGVKVVVPSLYDVYYFLKILTYGFWVAHWPQSHNSGRYTNHFRAYKNSPSIKVHSVAHWSVLVFLCPVNPT